MGKMFVFLLVVISTTKVFASYGENGFGAKYTPEIVISIVIVIFLSLLGLNGFFQRKSRESKDDEIENSSLEKETEPEKELSEKIGPKKDLPKEKEIKKYRGNDCSDCTSYLDCRRDSHRKNEKWISKKEEECPNFNFDYPCE